jgi:predicted benzoate:H+ symporter BenE
MVAATVASRPAAATCGSTVLSRRRRDATEVHFLIGYSIDRLLGISLAVWGFVVALCAADV